MDAAQLGCGIRTYHQPDKGFLLLFILLKSKDTPINPILTNAQSL